MVADNREHLAMLEYDLQGRSLDELSARTEFLLERAVAYTGQYRDVDDAAARIAEPSARRLFSRGISRSSIIRASGTRTLCWAMGS